jgi:alpha-acetolactate decarboxylase
MKLLVFAAILLAGCANPVHDNDAPANSHTDGPSASPRAEFDRAPNHPPTASHWQSDVEVYGALRAMFHQGQTQSMVNLAGLNKHPNLYAVGALADLSGEVTAYDGQLYLSYPEGKTGRSIAPTSTVEGATLLVTATAAEWTSVTTREAISFDQLDQRIGELAQSAGMDLEQRFPFRIEGGVEDLHYHIIDGSKLQDGGTSHKDHLAASIQVQAGNAQAKLIGFYSKYDERVFTHMGSTTHVHCILEEPLATGHVDHVTLPAGTVVQFPLR